MLGLSTPWVHWVTNEPHPFRVVTLDAQELVVAAGFGGRKPATCRLEFASGRITQRVPGASTMETVEPYEVSLSQWLDGPAVLRAHPFVLPHLFVTGVVDVAELRARFQGKPEENTIRSMNAITVPCDLLRMIGRPRMGLLLQTNFNLARGTAD